jgi:hypothetical protein
MKMSDVFRVLIKNTLQHNSSSVIINLEEGHYARIKMESVLLSEYKEN